MISTASQIARLLRPVATSVHLNEFIQAVATDEQIGFELALLETHRVVVLTEIEASYWDIVITGGVNFIHSADFIKQYIQQ